MGLLDRISYADMTAIPRNWNMTTMDTARIQERNDKSRLALEYQSGRSTSTPPQLLTLEGSHKISSAVGRMAPAQQSHDQTGHPPKTKRYTESTGFRD